MSDIQDAGDRLVQRIDQFEQTLTERIDRMRRNLTWVIILWFGVLGLIVVLASALAQCLR